MAAVAGAGGLQENLLGAGQGEQPAVPQQPMFPLDKRTLIHAAQPVAIVAIASTYTALVLAANGLDKETTSQHALAVLGALAFAYLPLGLFGLLIAVAVQKNPALVGLSSGCLLGHCLLPTVIGGVVNYVKAGEDLTVVTVVTAFMFVGTLAAWSILCSYPKFLHIRCCGAPVVEQQNGYAANPIEHVDAANPIEHVDAVVVVVDI